MGDWGAVISWVVSLALIGAGAWFMNMFFGWVGVAVFAIPMAVMLYIVQKLAGGGSSGGGGGDGRVAKRSKGDRER